MSKIKNLLALAIKGVLIIYLPVVLLLYIFYEVILKRDMIFSWIQILIYAVIIGISTARNYDKKTIEQDVEDFNSVKGSIIKGRWEIIEQNENRLIVRPKFDFPLRLLINSKVQIDYSEQKAIIEGPLNYANTIVNEINGKNSIRTRRITNIILIVLIIVLVSLAVFNELGFIWDIKKSIHNSFSKNIEVIEFASGEIVGNSIENTNNYGFGVENEDYIFYVEDHLNLIRVDKNFQNKKYLIRKSSGTGISRLNLAGDWIFYTSGKNLSRMRIDGTDNKEIYKLGYLLDIHMKDNWIYFINHSDDSNVYKMDINGRNLERFLEIQASDIALYENKIIFSHKIDDKAYVESISLDGSERNVELDVLAYDLIRWDGYYYFIGEDYNLYKNKVNGVTDPQRLVDGKVSSYVITDSGIFYSLHSEDVGYPGQDIFKMELDGTESTLVLDAERVGGFSRLGDFILFHSTDNDVVPEIKKLNIFTNEIESIKTQSGS